ncbi:MAG: Pyridoxal-dependent decarboxylase [Parcubacteria group bacterium GW2011_GWB1_43_6]|nr:MAG: Pyridoxal-dependent decarboxylase [Parcubacteria group bacterium GW2011_GWB1_43_6]
MAEEEIRTRLFTIRNSIQPFTSRALRKYSGVIHPSATEAIEILRPLNLNHLGTPTRLKTPSSQGIAAIEREVILMLGELMGSTEVDGYITQGGTEANIMGLWIGRNMLRVNRNLERKICLIKTSLTHYSIYKAIDLLDIPRVVDVPLNENYGMSSSELKTTLEKLANEGFREFLVVLTLGYNTTGTVDPIDEIDVVLHESEEKLGITTYTHLDAVIGGMIYPFATEKPLNFRYPSVKSIALDMNKNGFVSPTAGVFLARKGLQQWIERPAPYIKGRKIDDTLSGSRPGVQVAACWSAIQALGKEGFKKIVAEKIELKEYLFALLEKNKAALSPLIISHPSINVAAIHLGSFTEGKVPNFIEKKYSLTPLRFAIDEKNEKYIYTVVFMPHLETSVLEEFVRDLLQNRPVY